MNKQGIKGFETPRERRRRQDELQNEGTNQLLAVLGKTSGSSSSSSRAKPKICFNRTAAARRGGRGGGARAAAAAAGEAKPSMKQVRVHCDVMITFVWLCTDIPIDDLIDSFDSIDSIHSSSVFCSRPGRYHTMAVAVVRVAAG
jgi:hypothetical protein